MRESDHGPHCDPRLRKRGAEPREQDRRGDAKTVAPLRRIAERAADPEVLRINRWRRTKDMPLLGDSNDDRPPAVGGAQAA